jgi:hypothetical protein
MHQTPTQTAVPMAVRKLLASGQGGRLKADVTSWNLHQGQTVTPGGGEQQSNDNYSDDDSVDSKGSSITVIVDNSTEKRISINKPRTPASPDDSVPEEQQTLSPTNRVTPGTPCVFLCRRLKNYAKHRQKN